MERSRMGPLRPRSGRLGDCSTLALDRFGAVAHLVHHADWGGGHKSLVPCTPLVPAVPDNFLSRLAARE